MEANPEIHVVLSDDLLSHLRKVAQERHVPLRWLVAGLIYDTLETKLERTGDCHVALTPWNDTSVVH